MNLSDIKQELLDVANEVLGLTTYDVDAAMRAQIADAQSRMRALRAALQPEAEATLVGAIHAASAALGRRADATELVKTVRAVASACKQPMLPSDATCDALAALDEKLADDGAIGHIAAGDDRDMLIAVITAINTARMSFDNRRRAVIEAALAQNAAALRGGIDELRRELRKAQKTAALFEKIADVLNIAGRVLKVVI